jgi:betaine-aldehyde dehydrogenase
MHCFIGESREVGAGSQGWDKLSPADESLLFSVKEASAQQVQEALVAAKRALAQWSKLQGEARADHLRKLANLIERDQEIFSRMEAQETGRAIRETYAYDIPVTVESLRYYSGLIESEAPMTEQSSSFAAQVHYEPYGICLGIGAWNYPLQIAAWKMAPALAAGNVMIFKPSETTPSSVVHLAELCLEAGLPPGAFQVLQGREAVARRLIESPEVRKVSLTGSVETGRRVAALAGEYLKPVTMELGGKSPLLILPDADPILAAKLAVLANFYSAGQVCTNGTRVFLPAARKAEITRHILTLTQAIRLGDPLDQATECGPLVNRQQWEKVNAAIAKGVNEGAKLLCGGDRPKSFPRGYFLSPAVFTDVTDEMSLAREEIFGPVMSILSYESEEELIARANQLEFGLAAGIVAKDTEKAKRMATQLEAGVCWINTYNDTPLSLPFGGMKSSGIGRENGIQGLRQYQQTKTVLAATQELPDVFEGFAGLR